MPYATNPRDGVRIYYEIEGSGPPIVLHHGFSQTGVAWAEFGYRTELAGMRRVITIDARGHGRSAKPHRADAYAMSTMVSDVVTLLDHLEIATTDFYGYSMGGRVGFGLAAMAPSQLRCLIIGGAYPSSRRPSLLSDWIETLRSEGMSGYIALQERGGTRLPEGRRRELLDSDPLALAACLEAGLSDVSLEADVPMMTMATLLIAGENDTTVYDQARETATTMPDATFVGLPSLNHIEAMARSDLVLPHITAFLTGGTEAESNVERSPT